VSPTPLPRIEAGDFLVIHDTGKHAALLVLSDLHACLPPRRHNHTTRSLTGGYTLALFSRYCSRAAPAVVGYTVEGNASVRIEVLQESESAASVLGFWGDRRGDPKLL